MNPCITDPNFGAYEVTTEAGVFLAWFVVIFVILYIVILSVQVMSKRKCTSLLSPKAFVTAFIFTLVILLVIWLTTYL